MLIDMHVSIYNMKRYLLCCPQQCEEAEKSGAERGHAIQKINQSFSQKFQI